MMDLENAVVTMSDGLENYHHSLTDSAAGYGFLNGPTGGWRNSDAGGKTEPNSLTGECDWIWDWSIDLGGTYLVHKLVVAKMKPVNRVRSNGQNLYNRAL
jgi:hypothetical protein